MRFLSKRILLALGCGGAIMALATPAIAAETSNSEYVIIPEGDVFPDDLYAGAIRVVIDGTLEGDLIAFAAEEVVINGSVTGSVVAVTPVVTVMGEIGESLRVMGNSLTVTGDVGGDVVAAVFSAELSPTSEVQGDVLLWAWRAQALGSIGEDLTGSQRSLDLAGSVGGDVDVSVARLEVVDSLTVGGDLGYRSTNPATGLEKAEVAGTIADKAPLSLNVRVRALEVLGRLMVVLFLSIAALTAAYGWPQRTAKAIAGVGESPLRKWLVGALVLFSPLVAVLVTAAILGLAPAAAAFPLLAVLVPIVLALVGIAFALALVAGAPTVGWLGGFVFKRLDVYGSILSGSLMAGVVWFIPWVGWLVPLVVLPLGLGAWFGTWRQPSVTGAEPVS
jgi:hypothetical protein